MPGSFSKAPVGSAVQPCPVQAAPEEPSHWIEIEMVGDDGKPLGGEEYCVTLPDGVEVRGFLNADGFARIAGIKMPGTCQVTFPRLDGEAWEEVA